MTVLFAGPAPGPANAQGGDFQACLQTIKADALRQGVPADVAERAFQGLTPDQKVIDLDSRQPEFSLTYAKYVGSSVSPERIAKGQQKMAQNRALLDAIQGEYGVPPQTSWRSGDWRRITAATWATSRSCARWRRLAA